MTHNKPFTFTLLRLKVDKLNSNLFNNIVSSFYTKVNYVNPIYSRLSQMADAAYEEDLSSYPPLMRGKRSDQFFPLPGGYYKQFSRARTARSSPDDVSGPLEMRYFSPMLRG